MRESRPDRTRGSTHARPPSRPGSHRWAYRWLAALPGAFMLGGVPFANRVEPFVLGLPFLLFWIVLWVVLTSAVLGVVYALDRRAADPLPAAAGGTDGKAAT